MGVHNRGTGKCITFLRGLIGHEGNECVIWPYSRPDNRYGTLGYLGGFYYAHRLLCELINGPLPTPKHVCAHSCGHGEDGCVNPNHLSWKTPKGNRADTISQGKAYHIQPGSSSRKLNKQKAAEIRALKGKMDQYDVAEKYGVSHYTVARIQRGDAWNR